jgi:hypothetical protein
LRVKKSQKDLQNIKFSLKMGLMKKLTGELLGTSPDKSPMVVAIPLPEETNEDDEDEDFKV